MELQWWTPLGSLSYLIQKMAVPYVWTSTHLFGAKIKLRHVAHGRWGNLLFLDFPSGGEVNNFLQSGTVGFKGEDFNLSAPMVWGKGWESESLLQSLNAGEVEGLHGSWGGQQNWVELGVAPGFYSHGPWAKSFSLLACLYNRESCSLD